MRKLIKLTCRRTAGIAAGAVLAGGLACGVLLTPGAAYAATTTTATTATTIDSAGAPTFTADNPPLDATNGQSYSYTFQASGSQVHYSLGSGSPSWLHINSTTGTVSGTAPESGGSFTYYVVAQNGYGSVTSGPFTVHFGQSGRYGADVTSYLSCTSTVATGKQGTCTLYVTNRGNSAQDVTAQIALPSQLRLSSSGYYGYRSSGNTAQENLGTLRPGQTRELTVTFTAKSGLSLWGWHRGQRFQVEVTGSVSSNGGFSSYGQQDSSTAHVTIVPQGWWA